MLLCDRVRTIILENAIKVFEGDYGCCQTNSFTERFNLLIQ